MLRDPQANDVARTIYEPQVVDRDIRHLRDEHENRLAPRLDIDAV